MAPEMPQRPELSADRSARATSRGRFYVVLFTAFTMLTLLAFVSLFYAGFAVVVGLAVLLFLFHYIVWGWWLGRMIRQVESENPDTD